MAVQRRLAAILAADVAGYSRLMGEDEEGTLAALTAHRTELIEHAVKCAVAFQEGITERNADTPEDRRIVFRIGVNLGDVIVQDDDVYGDGVNVAARLETMADPGGVVISDKVQAEIRTRLY
jgi:class 3 adenylate cyclase